MDRTRPGRLAIRPWWRGAIGLAMIGMLAACTAPFVEPPAGNGPAKGGGSGQAEVELDPGIPLTPDATAVALLVTERACNSGEGAAGRVRVERLEVTDSEVQVAIGVVPRPGAHDCQGNPPTPFLLELDEPIGARSVVDVSVDPPRTLGAAQEG